MKQIRLKSKILVLTRGCCPLQRSGRFRFRNLLDRRFGVQTILKSCVHE